MSEWMPKAEIACDCGGETLVVNARGRSKKDVVHRQRVCKRCGVKFSTFESRRNPTDKVRATRTLDRLERAIQKLQQLKDEMSPR